MGQTKNQRSLLKLMPLLCLAGLTTIHAEPTAVDDLSRITDIEKITLLPAVVVAELPEGNEAKLLKLVRKQLALELALKGYALKRASQYSAVNTYSAPDIAGMSLQDLSTLGPHDATHLMILFVNALDGKSIVIAESSKSKLAAVLIEKSTGDLLWRNEADRNFTALWFNWGIIGMLIINEDEMAIWSAFKALFKEFPDRPMS